MSAVIAVPPRQLALVLVEPAGALNVGSVARLCANFSSPALTLELRLVAPRCRIDSDEALRMAVHGRSVLQAARVYPDLAAALADCEAVLATTGRGEGEPQPVLDQPAALRWLLAHGRAEAPAALVFGREDRGLSGPELLQAGALLQIATGPAYLSLNLSHAVAVVLHGLHVELMGPPPAPAASPLAPRGPLEAMLADAEELLLQVGFLYPHTAAARMARVRGLLQRAGISPEEVALLRGMVRQCRWATGRGRKTS